MKHYLAATAIIALATLAGSERPAAALELMAPELHGARLSEFLVTKNDLTREGETDPTKATEICRKSCQDEDQCLGWDLVQVGTSYSCDLLKSVDPSAPTRFPSAGSAGAPPLAHRATGLKGSVPAPGTIAILPSPAPSPSPAPAVVTAEVFDGPWVLVIDAPDGGPGRVVNVKINTATRTLSTDTGKIHRIVQIDMGANALEKDRSQCEYHARPIDEPPSSTYCIPFRFMIEVDGRDQQWTGMLVQGQIAGGNIGTVDKNGNNVNHFFNATRWR